MNPMRDEAPQPDVEFSGLYRTYAHELRRFAVFLSGNPALADDLVSEAFVRAWSVRGRIEFSTVRGYLFAIVRNLFLQQIRHERRRRPLDERMIDERPGPEARASEQDDLRVVLEALAALPEIDRAAVLMRADDGLAYEEIATALGISVASAKVKVHRARLRLAEVLTAARGAERIGEKRS
ncbi:MAG: sigma-70 family RNA polymerase sigma factor [Acidobacteria bacterium]|nr:sigma-70 family RNA polymerase sigma factor [Acidobacteriota bacterium]